MRAAVILVGLAACGGIPENEFIPGYVERLCEHELTCSDPAQLTFDGIVTVEDCVLQREREVASWGAGCRYRAADAAICLEDMALLQCPAAEGTLAERPASCVPVYFDCTAAADDGGDEAEG